VLGARRREFPRRLFCQELAVLLDAGIPLYESLQTLREKEDDAAVALVLGRLSLALSEGQTLAQAMRAHPEAFTTLLVASVEAAQRTGQLSVALRQHAAYLAWAQGLRDKLVGAAIYPIILIGASTLVIGFLTVFVVPRFAEIYDGMGGELPWLSALLLKVGRTLGEHPMAALMALGLAAGLGVWAFRLPATRRWMVSRLWQAPVVGPRMRLIELASLYRTLGLLLQAGVPVVPVAISGSGKVTPKRAIAIWPGPIRVAVGEPVRPADFPDRTALLTEVRRRVIALHRRIGGAGGDEAAAVATAGMEGV
jgi:general secretion pathway protein F